MKKTLTLFILTLLIIFQGYPQGIEFSIYESETVSKTSYNVFSTKSPVFEGYLALKFDLAIHESGFGYIFRIKDRRSANPDIYSLVFSYDTHSRSNLKLNIEARTSLLTDTLDNVELRPRHWMPVVARFYLEGDSVTLTIRNKHFVAHKVGLPASIQPEILFGSSTFSQEMPPFAIRNLTIESPGETYRFPLNESAGNHVHNDKGKIMGTTINPVWLINKSYHWNLSWTFSSRQVAGSCFNPVSSEMLVFNRDSLIKVDLSRDKTDIFTFPSIPMKLQLGTSFYNPANRSLYAYEVNGYNGGIMVGSIDIHNLQFKPLSDRHLPSLRHHHACYLDVTNQKYYVFGGFGSRKYHNDLEMLDLGTGEWSNIPLTGEIIAPRFFASMGALNENELLLFGGTGNSTGDQAVGKLHYYDLYSINLCDGLVRKIWEFTPEGQDFVPVRELIVADDKKSFYTLCYPMHLANSYLRLYNFSVEEGSYTLLGDSIPMESKAILSNANLYYNRHTNEYYCCTQEFQEYGGDPSQIKIYTLAAPAISADMLSIYDEEKSSLLTLSVILLATILITIVTFILLRKRMAKQDNTHDILSMEPSVSIPKPAAAKAGSETIQESRKNSIYIFGDFAAYDKQGHDVTYMFSNKIKHLFLLTLLKSLDGTGSITSSYMYGMLWPDKDGKSAKNLKGVFISRLRKVLEEFDGINFVYHNNLYNIELSDDVYCDYREYIELINCLKNTETAGNEQSEQLISILNRGKLMRSVDMESFDNLKAEHEEKFLQLIRFELEKLYNTQQYDRAIMLSEAVIRIDPFNDMALWYLLNACHRQKKDDIAMKKYYLFTANYSRDMRTEYAYSYQDIIRNPYAPSH